MGYLKFSSNLFLGEAELKRLKSFLDDNGFRSFLLHNSNSFGLIKKYNESFTNGSVTEDTGTTIAIAEAKLIDSNGNLVYTPAVSQLAVPNDNNWYWVKIGHDYSSDETGTYSIDSSGNLVCTTSNGELLSILRGQPNYPSRIRFTNATNNTLTYDVLEVIDDNNAVLQGDFTNETDLNLSVVGTFTPGYVPLSEEKDIFQYDYSIITLVQSNTSTEPAHTSGEEFFLARVKRNGVTLKIEDKRNEIWTTNSNYYLRNIELSNNPLIGVEQITYDDQYSPRDKNMLQIGWGFRAVTYSVDLKNNKITVSAGAGGNFKSSNFGTRFTNTGGNTFDGWRLYSEDGKYYNIIASVLNGGNIELTFDNLEATSFFSDVDSSTPISQVLSIVPEAEEIEIICTPDQDLSDVTDINGIVEVRKVFSINELYGRIPLQVYHPTAANYTITYRYKHILDYSAEFLIEDDAVGYYAEDQFNVNGYRTGSTTTGYTSGIVTLLMSSKSYSNFQAKVDTGDYKGVNSSALSNANPFVNLTVGGDKQYQYFTGSGLSLAADMYINVKNVDVEDNTVRDGAAFIFQFKQAVTLNGFNLYITYGNSLTPSSNTVIKQFTSADEAFIPASPQGMFFIVTYDATNSRWIINQTNESKVTSITTNATQSFPNGGSRTDISGITFTTPNDGITRKYSIRYKGNFVEGSPTSAAGVAVYLMVDGVDVDSNEVSANMSAGAFTYVNGTLVCQWLADIAPNKIIKVQGVSVVSNVDITKSVMIVEQV